MNYAQSTSANSQGVSNAATMLNLPMLLEAAREMRAEGKLEEALEILTSTSESSAELCIQRAEIEFALERFQDAAVSYLALTIADSENSNAHFNMALCLERCGRWDVAAEAFRRALNLDPQRTDARVGLGACLLSLNRPEEALASFDQCSPKGGPAVIGKAVALQLLARFDESRKMYEAVLASDPNSEEAFRNLIALAIETQDLEKVRNYAVRLLTIRPESTVALQALATAALYCSDHRGAASYCDRILELAPDCLEAWHNFRIATDRFTFSSAEPGLAVHAGGKQ